MITMNNLLDQYRDMLNSFKHINAINGQQFLKAESQLGTIEKKIGRQIIADNPNIWGEFDYIIFDINADEGDVIPIKCVDLNEAQNVSISLQRKYYNSTNIYFTGRIHSRIPQIDPYTGREMFK